MTVAITVTIRATVIITMPDVLKFNRGRVSRFQNAEASYDFSSNDPFPYPRYTDDWFNR